MPVGLALYLRELKALFVVGGGLALVWPLYVTAGKSKPSAYDPDRVPEDFYP